MKVIFFHIPVEKIIKNRFQNKQDSIDFSKLIDNRLILYKKKR